MSHRPASTAACPGSSPTNQAATGDCSMLSSGCRCRPAYIACALASGPSDPPAHHVPCLWSLLARALHAPRSSVKGRGRWEEGPGVGSADAFHHDAYAVRACCRKPLTSPQPRHHMARASDLPACRKYIVRAPSGVHTKISTREVRHGLHVGTDVSAIRAAPVLQRTHQASWVRASLDGAHRDTTQGSPTSCMQALHCEMTKEVLSTGSGSSKLKSLVLV